MSPTRKVAIGLIAATPVLAAAVYFVGPGELAGVLVQAGWGAFATIGITLYMLIAAQAAAWARLERELGDKPPFRTLLSSTIVAFAGNTIMPSAHLGGEPAKILYAGRNTGIPYTRLAGTVLLCKYIEAISFVVFFALGAAATLVGLSHVLLSPEKRFMGIGLVVVTAAAMVLSAIMWLALARRWTPLTAIVGVAARLPFRRTFAERLWKRCLRMELGASRVFCEERKAVTPAFFWYLLTHALMFVRPWLFFYVGLGKPLNAAELSLLFLTAQLMLAVQFMPSGLGTLDGGMLSAVALAGMNLTVPECAAYLLAVRFWDATVVVLGMLLAARTGMGLFRRAPRPEPASTTA